MACCKLRLGLTGVSPPRFTGPRPQTLRWRLSWSGYAGSGRKTLFYDHRRRPLLQQHRCQAWAPVERAVASLNALQASIVAKATAVVNALKWAWTSWLGIIVRWSAALVVFSTVFLNALAVPYMNARVIPDIERRAASVLMRPVALEGIRWISPPGALGMGPLVSLQDVAVGPREAEQSEAAASGAHVHLRPLSSLVRRQLVLDLEIQHLDVAVRQNKNYSWFGYPDETDPPSRDFLPGLSEPAPSGPSSGPSAATSGSGAGGGPAGGAAGARHGGGEYRNVAHGSDVGVGVLSDAASHDDSYETAAAVDRADRTATASSSTSIDLANSEHDDVRRHVAAAANSLRCTLASITSANQQHSSRPAPVALRHVKVLEGNVMAFVHGDLYPRRFSGAALEMTLSSDYRDLDLDVTSDVHMRESAAMRCTMPVNPGMRHMRHCTPGGEIAPINSFPITQQGPSPASLAKMQRQAMEAGRPGVQSMVSSPPGPAQTSAAQDVGLLQRGDRSARSLRSSPFGSTGGKLRIVVTARGIGVPDVWPSCTVRIEGEHLHAPMVERLFELPMDIYGGRLDGALEMYFTDTKHWTEFPAFGGRLQVSDAAFHFWDSPDDFSAANMTLHFERDRLYLLNAQGTYGAATMAANGELGLNPETGQYSIQAKVDSVDVNALRATLGARPLPYPIAGSVGGSMQVYGPLAEPVFAGYAESRPMTTIASALAERTDAFDALETARRDGVPADLAYDKVPFTWARAMFTMDTRSGLLSVPSAQAVPLGGGLVRATGTMNLDPAAESDPKAIRAEFSGEDLSLSPLLAYLPDARTRSQGVVVRDRAGKIKLRGLMSGSHIAPVIRSSMSAPQVHAECAVMLARERATCAVRAPAVNMSATLFTEFPPYEVQKTALTQAAAIAMREPRVKGGSIDAHVQDQDIMPLMRALDVGSEGDGAGAPPQAQSSSQASASSAADVLSFDHAAINGRVKVWLGAVESPQDRLQADGGAVPMYDLAPFAKSSSPQGAEAGEFIGKIEVADARFNQLQIVKNLEGNFTVKNGRLKLSAEGGRQLPESLAIDFNVDTGSSVMAAGAAAAAERGGVATDEWTEAAEAENVFELKSGRMRLMGRVDNGLQHADIQLAHLPLDGLELSSLRGTIQALDATVDVPSRCGHALLDVTEPQLEGLKAHRLHAEADAENGVVRLHNTTLQQGRSSYSIEGQYTLPREVALMDTSGPSAVIQAAAADDAVSSDVRGIFAVEDRADEARMRSDLESLPGSESVDASADAADPAARPAAMPAGALDGEAAPGPFSDRSAEVLEPAASMSEPAAHAAGPGRRDLSDPKLDDFTVQVATDQSPLIDKMPAESSSGAVADEEQAWWVRVKADAQLQDFLPVAEVASRPQQTPAELAESKASFARAVESSAWALSDPRTAKAQVRVEDAKKLRSRESLPGLSALTGHLKGEVAAFGDASGASRVQIDVNGEDWRWGPITMEDMLLSGSLDGTSGLHVDKLQLRAEGSTFSMQGNLLNANQDATVELSSFPLEVFEPLVQVALPHLQATRPNHDQLGSIGRPIAALQRQLRRAAVALELPHQSLEPALADPDASLAPIRGLLHVNGKVGGSLDKPEGNVHVRVEQGSFGGVKLSEASATAALSRQGVAKLRGRIMPASASGGVTVKADVRTRDTKLLVDATVDVRDGGMLVLSEAGGNAVTWIDGKAHLMANVRGPVRDPTVVARAHLSRARVGVPYLKEPLSAMSANIAYGNDRLTVHSFQAQAGRGGSVRGSGSLPLQPADNASEELQLNCSVIEMRHPALNGQVDSDIVVRNSLTEPRISGDLRLSKGSLLVPGLTSTSSGPVDGAAASAPNEAPATPQNKLFNTLLASRRGAAALRQQAALPALAPTPPGRLSTVSLAGMKIGLGPDLSVAAFPFLQIDLRGSVQLDGPPVPDAVRASGEIELGPGTVNVFATQFAMDRGHRNVVAFGGDPGLDPALDIALVSREFQISCKSKLRDAAKAVTITRLSDGSKVLGAADAPVLFEQQLRALLLEDDGQFAVQSMVLNTLSSMLPRIEGSGTWGNARWRLLGGPAPLADPKASKIVLGAQAEAEMAYGDHLRVLLSSQHLADAKFQMTYELAPGVRAYVAYTAPRSNVTVMLDLGDAQSNRLMA